ncbi:MAG: EF-hand domain-containing protein [Candidatus Heimdallarchaeota archaeon]|nr:EF-hand domain-containing protein [Candidatus Heimdallarchaeota archaeon]
MRDDLNDDKKELLRKIFDSLDKDKNGYLDKEELTDAMKKLGFKLNEGEMTALLQTADAITPDGRIDYIEFINYMDIENFKQQDE